MIPARVGTVHWKRNAYIKDWKYLKLQTPWIVVNILVNTLWNLSFTPKKTNKTSYDLKHLHVREENAEISLDKM